MAGRRADVLDIREILRRLQLGERDRRIARDLHISRKTVSKYHAWAAAQGLLTGPLPEAAALQATLAATLPVVAGATLATALDPLIGPKPAEDGTPDPRTRGQRTADGLTALAELSLAQQAGHACC